MKLLPCPFCGDTAAHVTAANPKFAKYVMCVYCNSTTPMTDTAEQAATVWNRRAANAELSALRQQKDELLADAERYRWIRSRTRGVRTTGNNTFALPHIAPLANVMQGSVAEHLDNAIDAAAARTAITRAGA